MSTLWQLSEICAAVGAAAPATELSITGVDIDSRALKPGDLFVALRAVRDGHDFLPAAQQAGAAAALVSCHAPSLSLPQVMVDDTLSALGRLALAARERCGATRIAVTGSSGKTSLANLVSLALGGAHRPEKSYNNHWGVPLTLARLPREATHAVFEIGTNTPGEIAPLSHLVAPHIAVVVNIAPVHIGGFKGEMAALIAEKLSITAGLTESGVLIVPEEGAQSWPIPPGCSLKTFGTGERADARLLSAEPTAEGQTIHAEILGSRLSFHLPLTGFHMAMNAVAALLVATLSGTNPQAAAHNLEAAQALPGRGLCHRAGGVTVVDESFNANPLSMAAALKNFSHMPVPGRRFAILGDMLELGEKSDEFHKNLATACAGLDGILCVGELMGHLYRALPANKQLGHVPGADTINLEAFVTNLEEGDTVLVKGSKVMFWARDFVPRLVKALEKHEAGAA